MTLDKASSCTSCGQRFTIGDFAYNQELCYKCFTIRVQHILTKIDDPEEKQMIRWMASACSEWWMRNMRNRRDNKE